MKRHTLLFVFAALVAAACTGHAQTAADRVRFEQFEGPVSGVTVRYGIYLPHGYETSNERYPVIYFLHGMGGSEQSDAVGSASVYERARDAGLSGPVIIVSANSYENGMWADSFDGAKPVETNVIHELIPHVDNTYRTLADRRHRAVMGFSMGGYGAIGFAVKFPWLFCAASSIDGWFTDWMALEERGTVSEEIFGGDELYYNRYNPWLQAQAHDGLIGDGETGVRLVVGRFTQENRLMRNHLQVLGVPVEYVETECEHNLGCLQEAEGIANFAFLWRWIGNE